MRVVLTGAGGFIGSAVWAALAAAGVEVVPVDAYIEQAHGESPPDDARVHRIDLRDGSGLADLLAGVDVVCHQAAMVGAGLTAADLPLYAAHNDLATAVLLAAMAVEDIGHFVLASSMVVYGDGRYRCAQHGAAEPAPRARGDLDAGQFDVRCPRCQEVMGWELVDEEAALRPRSSYAASKVAQEHYAAAWARQAGGRVVALRYHNVYGPGMPQDTPYSGVAAMFRSSMERGEPPQVFEDGGQMRDFVHVHDVARANLLAISAVRESPTDTFAAYNVASGMPVSIGDVAATVSTAVGGPAPVVTGEFRSGDVRHIVASPARAARELGFRAEISPADGLHTFATDPLRHC